MGIERIWNTGSSCVLRHDTVSGNFLFYEYFGFFVEELLSGTPSFWFRSSMYSLWMLLLLYIMQQREQMKGIPRSELAIICLMNSNPPIPDISESYLDSLCEYHIHFLMWWLSPLIFSFSIWTSSYTCWIVKQICSRHAIRSLQLFLF